MRVLIDTNILLSATFKQDGRQNYLLGYLGQHLGEYEIFVTDQNLEELERNVTEKKPRLWPRMRRLLTSLRCQTIEAEAISSIAPTMRDTSDQPILNAAVAHGIDVILTGDEDFLSLGLKRPRCLSATSFMAEEKITLVF